MINNLRLLEWMDKERHSYLIQPEELSETLQLKSCHKSIKLVLQTLAFFHQLHGINLLSYCKNPNGLKIHLNGIKRLLPLQITQEKLKLIELIDQVRPVFEGCEPPEMLYNLTGWIPEELKMGDITSFTGIFERLSTNLEEGNTLIFFSRTHKDTKQYVLLKSVDMKEGTIEINPCSCQISVPPMFFSQLN